MSMVGANFTDMVIQSIQKGLDPMGTASRRVVFWFLEDKKKLSLDQIPEHAEEFVDTLKALLGQGGEFLERHIISELETAFHTSLKQERLVDALSSLRAVYNSPRNRHANNGGSATTKRG